ncbi:MAG: hypothetical protein ACR2N4_10320 [Jatrophihabitans sp.]
MLKQLSGGPGPIRRLGAIIAGSAATALLLTGCAAGQHTQTVGQAPPIDGASAAAGDIAVRAAGLLAPDNGTSYAKGGTAQLQLVLINNSAQATQLVSVSSPAAGSAQVSNVGVPQVANSSAAGSTSPSPSDSPSSSASASDSSSAEPSATGSPIPAPVNQPIQLPAGENVQVGFDVLGPNISLTGLTAALFPAQTVPVTFTFANGASVTVNLPVKLDSTPPSAPIVGVATSPAD